MRPDAAAFDKLIDSSPGAWPRDQALRYRLLACKCCQEHRYVRPKLTTVLTEMGELAALAAKAPQAESAQLSATSADQGARRPVEEQLEIDKLFVCPITTVSRCF
jgi:hypothetical protein